MGRRTVAQAVVVGSGWGQAFVINGVAKERLFIVPEAVDAEVFKPGVHQPLIQKQPREFVFLSVFKFGVHTHNLPAGTDRMSGFGRTKEAFVFAGFGRYTRRDVGDC